MSGQREGRGRLSSIDLLPREADPHVQWAAAALLERDRTQEDIRAEFNERLATIGCDPISSSAFNRYSTGQAALTRQITETREIAKAVLEVVGPDQADEMTVLLVQLMKQVAVDHFRKGSTSPKEMKEIGQALSAIMAAQRASAENKAKVKAEQDALMEKAAQTAAAAIAGKTPGTDPAEILAAIRKGYGWEPE